MQSAIEAMWSGNIAVSENCGVGKPEIEKLVCLIERNQNALENTMGQEQKILLEKYISNADELQYLLTRNAFCDGFSLACKLMTEALSRD